jgi:hypothetical protein
VMVAAKKPLSRGYGPDLKRVVVDEIIPSKGLALCRDQYGDHIQVPTTLRQGKGGWAKAGEEWIISREFGAWSFMAISGEPNPVVISTPRDGADELTVALLDALKTLGFVVEEGDTFEPNLDG